MYIAATGGEDFELFVFFILPHLTFFLRQESQACNDSEKVIVIAIVIVVVVVFVGGWEAAQRGIGAKQGGTRHQGDMASSKVQAKIEC